jgi:hypothetical protein
VIMKTTAGGTSGSAEEMTEGRTGRTCAEETGAGSEKETEAEEEEPEETARSPKAGQRCPAGKLSRQCGSESTAQQKFASCKRALPKLSQHKRNAGHSDAAKRTERQTSEG